MTKMGKWGWAVGVHPCFYSGVPTDPQKYGLNQSPDMLVGFTREHLISRKSYWFKSLNKHQHACNVVPACYMLNNQINAWHLSMKVALIDYFKENPIMTNDRMKIKGIFKKTIRLIERDFDFKAPACAKTYWETDEIVKADKQALPRIFEMIGV